MTEYVITSTDVSEWTRCNAKTARGAKCIAEKEYGMGFIGSLMKVGIRTTDGDGAGYVHAIAVKVNRANARWYCIDE